MRQKRYGEQHEEIDYPGYWIFENVFSDEECDLILDVIDSKVSRRRGAGIRNLISSSEIAELAGDNRLIQITAKVSGRPMVPFKATLFEKTGKAIGWLPFTRTPLCRWKGRRKRQDGVRFQ